MSAEVVSDRRPVLVGEDNPYGSEPRYALYPLPERASGGRLCYKILGMETTEYLRAFRRVNLCVGKWSMKEARVRADELHCDLSMPVLILLGAKVCRAYGIPYSPLMKMPYGRTAADGIHRDFQTVLVLPHPSGLCRAWNDPTLAPRCRAAVMEILNPKEPA